MSTLRRIHGWLCAGMLTSCASPGVQVTVSSLCSGESLQDPLVSLGPLVGAFDILLTVTRATPPESAGRNWVVRVSMTLDTTGPSDLLPVLRGSSSQPAQFADWGTGNDPGVLGVETPKGPAIYIGAPPGIGISGIVVRSLVRANEGFQGEWSYEWYDESDRHHRMAGVACLTPVAAQFFPAP